MHFLLRFLSEILELFNNVLLGMLIEVLKGLSWLSYLFSWLEDLRNLFFLLFSLLNWCWFGDFLKLLRLFFLLWSFFVETQKAIQVLNWGLVWNWSNQLWNTVGSTIGWAQVVASWELFGSYFRGNNLHIDKFLAKFPFDVIANIHDLSWFEACALHDNLSVSATGVWCHNSLEVLQINWLFPENRHHIFIS